jgi:cysteinyl-tRNA synthetase
MAAAMAGVERLTQALHRPSPPGGAADEAGDDLREEAGEYRRRFVEAMEDDLHTPRALAVLFDLAGDINRRVDAGLPAAAHQAGLRELAGVLGFALPDPAEAATALLDGVALSNIAAELDVAWSGKDATATVEALVAARQDARAAKDFARSDRIRDALAGAGVTLEDGSAGTRWSVKR